MARGDDDQEEKPVHIRARDEAVKEAFECIKSSRGRVPDPIEFTVSQYFRAVERDCVRELFGLASDWRAPFVEEWRAYPEEDEDVAKKQHNTLIAVLERRRDSVNLVLCINYSNGYATSPPLDAGSLLSPGDRRLAFFANLKQRAAAMSRDLYVEVGYVGDVVSGLATAREMAWRGRASGIAGVLAGLQPSGADWALSKSEAGECTNARPLNEPQRVALEGMRSNVQLVHGPPGTGKTHMVAALVERYFSVSEAVVISAVQNRAIEAIAAHFVKAGVPFVASGRRLTGVCLDFTIEKKVERHAEVAARKLHLRRVTVAHELLSQGVRRLERSIYSPPNILGEDSHQARVREQLVERLVAEPSREFAASTAYVQWKTDTLLHGGREALSTPAAQRALRDIAKTHARVNVDPWAKVAQAVVRRRYPRAVGMRAEAADLVEQCRYRLEKAREEAELELLQEARALLVTTASLGGAVRSPQLKALTERVKAITVDEAGTVADRHLVPVLAACERLDRAVFVGDTRQLPVFSNVRNSSPVSTMQRLEERGMATALLSKQYRMPPLMGDLVSKLFYESALQSASAANPLWPTPVRCLLVPSGRAERESERSPSMLNQAEAQEVVRRVRQLKRDSGEDSVAVLSPYAAQTRLLQSSLSDTNDIEFLSVDAAQGREWDHVFLTTVTTERRHAGFVRDPRRLCVALSRARSTLTLVTSPNIARSVPALSAVLAASHNDPEHVQVLSSRMARVSVTAGRSEERAHSVE